MRRWKYVLWLAPDGKKYPVIFPDVLTHKDVAEVLPLNCRELPYERPFSAGFIHALKVGGVEGRSDSMNIDGDEGDRSAINNMEWGA